jgi:hypothetical protein
MNPRVKALSKSEMSHWYRNFHAPNPELLTLYFVGIKSIGILRFTCSVLARFEWFRGSSSGPYNMYMERQQSVTLVLRKVQ